MPRKYLVFECLGDAEKNLLGTAVVSLLHKKHSDRDIIVVSNLPDIWLHNPEVFRIFEYAKTPYFYEDYVVEKDTLIFRQDPYRTDAFIHQTEHIIKSWAELCGVTYEAISPSLHLTQREKEVLIRVSKKEKPLFLFSPSSVSYKDSLVKVWARNMPVTLACEIAKRITEKGFQVITPFVADTPDIPFVEKITLPLRLMLALPSVTVGNILSHGVLVHSAKALQKKSLVIWGKNKPEIYGYSDDINIIPKEESITVDSFKNFAEPLSLQSQQIGNLPEKKYDEKELFAQIDEYCKSLQS